MLTKVLQRRSVLFWISDFTEPIPLEEAAFLAKRHDMVVAVLKDPLETGLQLPARVAVRDPETGKVGFLSPGSLKAYQKADQFRESQLKTLTSRGVDRLNLTAGAGVVTALRGFFKTRMERMGRR
jgi:hypothetical protein